MAHSAKALIEYYEFDVVGVVAATLGSSAVTLGTEFD